MATKNEFSLLKNIYEANHIHDCICFVILNCLKLEKSAWQIYIKIVLFVTGANIHRKFVLSFLILSRCLPEDQFQIHKKEKNEAINILLNVMLQIGHNLS